MIHKFSTFIYLAICFFLLVQVGLSSWRSTDGDRVSDIQRQIAQLELENNSLKLRIYELTSLENISHYASANHMQPALVSNLSAITVALNR